MNDNKPCGRDAQAAKLVRKEGKARRGEERPYRAPEAGRAFRDKGNVILIGMPGAGKSTVGVILAKTASKAFVDTDVLIQVAEGRSLQNIVDRQGHMALRSIEERTILSLDVENSVIATGGSAVYSRAAMNHLRTLGAIVFLDVDLAVLELRIRNFRTRGLAKRPEQTLEDLFEERHALYLEYADIVVSGSGRSQEEVCADIVDRLDRLRGRDSR